MFEFSYADLGLVANSGLAERLKLSVAFDCDGAGSCQRWTDLDAMNDLTQGVIRATIPEELLKEFDQGGPGVGGPGTPLGQFTAAAVGGGFVVPGAGTGGINGDYAASQATSLTAGQVGVQSGAAQASYSFPLPPAGAGVAPSLGLTYSSAVVDGTHAGANGQDMFGTGWSLDVGSISRAYADCGGPIHGESGNRCLVDGANGDRLENLSLSLNGVSSRLVLESSAGSTHQFRLENDPNWRVELVENSESWAAGVVDMSAAPGGGFWLLTGTGEVYSYGGAQHAGNPTLPAGESAVAIVAKPASGYWIVTDAGSVFDGAAPDGTITLNAGQTVVDAAASSGTGYRAVTNDGQVFNLNGATSATVNVTLGAGEFVVGIVSSSQTDGFWILSNTGEVFNSTNVSHHGDTSADPSIGDVVDIASWPGGSGYWILGDDGGVFTFGAAGIPFDGSAYSWVNSAPAAIAADPDGGYWVSPDLGRVVPFGGADVGTSTEPDWFRSSWTVYTPDGTQFSFGSSFEPTSNAATNSVQTFPVYMAGGVDEGCPDDLCDMAYRWNLDRVEDVHGNVVSYFYDQSNNYYNAKLANAATSLRRYTNASDLTRIEYAKLAGSEDQVAPVRVHLDYEYRCAAANGCTDPNAAMPDVPSDLICVYGQTACTVTTPSFFTKLRLAQITTESVAANGTASPVNQWDFSYAYPSTGDNTPSRLWLDSISQTGLSGGGSMTLPPVSYEYVMLPNRVNAPAAGYNSTMPRLASILNEYGGLTEFSYFQSNPPQNNDINQPCWSGAGGPGFVRPPCDYFVAWAPNITPGLPGGFVLWNKYKVQSLTRSSNFDATPGLDDFHTDETLTYEYSTPIWAYSDTPSSYDLWDPGVDCNADGNCNHWNDFRGHRTVTVTDATGRTVYTSFTGLDGDPLNGLGATPTIASSVTEAVGGASFVDEPWLTGNTIEIARQTLDQPPVNETRTTTTYTSGITAGVGDHAARWIAPALTNGYSYSAGANPTVSQTSFEYDTFGNPTRTISEGDPATSTDDSNTVTVWATAGDLTVPVRETTHATDQIAGAIVADVEYQYDNGAWGAAPAGVGNMTGMRTRDNGVTLVDAAASYDARGRFAWTEDGLANRTSYQYDSRYGYLNKVTDPASNDTTYVVEPGTGAQTSITDPDGDTATLGYDALGRLTSVDMPGGGNPDSSFIYAPNPNRNLPMIIQSSNVRNGADEHRVWSFLDGFGTTMQTQEHVTASTMIVTSNTVENGGASIRSSAPFDAAGNAGQNGFFQHTWAAVPSSARSTIGTRGNTTTSEILGANNTVVSVTSNSIAGNTTTAIDENGAQWTTTVNAFGQTLTVDEPAGGGTTSYAYDPAGRLISVVDDVNNTTTIGYDIAGRKTSMSDPDTGTWTYVYDQANNLVRQSNGAGQWTGIDYDTLGRPTRRYKTDSNGTDNGALATFNYDPAGATGKVASSVAETDDGQVTVGYEYDNRDQLTRQTWTIPGLPAGSAYIGWTYDDGGLVDTIDYNGTETIDYTYDLAGRPITLVGGTETYVSAATYTASGQLTTLTSGAANDPNRLNRTWQYDPATLLVSTITAGVGASTTNVANATYGRDIRGNITSVIDSGQAEVRCYGYDTLSRLTRAYTSSIGSGCDGTADPIPAGNGFDNTWTYNTIGNITNATGAGTPNGAYSYNGTGGPHAANTAGTNTYAYDTAGNMTARTVGVDTVHFGYDWDNRLITAGTTTGADDMASFLYDADGQRVRRTVPDGPTTTFYLGGLHEIEITGDLPTPQAPTPATPIPGLNPTASALLVVGAASPITTSDAALNDRLDDLGFTVTVLDDDNVAVGAVTGYDLIVLSATVNAAGLSTTFKTLTTPLVNLKPFAQLYQLGMVETEGLADPSVDLVNITDPTSPLAAGYAGTNYLTTDDSAIGWGLKPAGSDMKIVATTPDGKPTLYWYAPGDNMATENGNVNTAPACRIQFPADKTSPEVQTQAGWSMFDRSIWWAVSQGCTFPQAQPESTTAPFCRTDTPPVDAAQSKHWVSDILVVGNTAYITGNFNTLYDADGITAHTRNGLGACDLTTGDVISGFGDFGLDAEGLTLAVEGNWLYIGGAFTQIGGNTNLSYLARINLNTNTVDASWDPNPNKKVWALEFNSSATKMFVGGNFNTFGPNNDPVEALVKINLSDGSRIGGFTPDFDGFARVAALDRVGATLYIGGDFTGIADSNSVMHARTSLAAVDTTTGDVIATFDVDSLDDHNPLEAGGNPEPAVEAVFEHNGRIYACGDWWTTDGQGQVFHNYPTGKANQYNVARFNPANGNADHVAGGETYALYPDPFPAVATSEAAQDAHPRTTATFPDRPWGPRNDGGVAECIPDTTSNLMYVAGHWDIVTGPNNFGDALPIGKIIAVDLDSGHTINTWDAETNSIRGLDALAVIPGQAIILGGAFTQSGGQNLNGLARFNLLEPATLTPPTATPAALQALLVVANPASLTTGETAIKTRLENQGGTVTVVDDNTATATDADGQNLVLISQSISSSALGNTFASVDAGVIVWKPSLYDDMGLTTTPGGTTSAQTDIDITEPAHPLAAGLTGTATVYNAAKNTTNGTPAASADVIADTAGAATTPVIFAYNQGDTLADNTTANGPRVGFYFDTNGPDVATTNGWALFDAATAWAATGNQPAAPAITQRSNITFAGQLVATHTDTGQTNWIATDHLGSPTATINATAGNTATALYYPYGQSRTSQLDATYAGFTGQTSDLDTGTGLLYYNARYYDPGVGRFTQADIVTVDGLNRYTYVNNNPINYTDPTGFCVNWDGTIMTQYAECSYGAWARNMDEMWASFEDWQHTAARDEIEMLQGGANWGNTYIINTPGGRASAWGQARVLMALATGEVVRNPSTAGSRGFMRPDCDGMCILWLWDPLSVDFTGDQSYTFDTAVVVEYGMRWKFPGQTGGGFCSFSAESEVVMADRSTKPISEVEVGEWVLAHDPRTGRGGSRQVTDLWVHEDMLLELQIDDYRLSTTEDHPFWSVTDGEWQRADHLESGDQLLTADNALVEVVGLDRSTEVRALAYNLTVEGLNTFYVGVGSVEVLVHNTEGCPPWQLKTDTNFQNQVLDGPLPQTGQLSGLTKDQLQNLRSDLLVSIRNRQRNLWDGTFPQGTQKFRDHAARIDLEVGLLDRVDDLLG